MAVQPRAILANVQRLHAFMDQLGYAAVVVRSGKNFTYLAGFAYPGTLARHLEFPDSPREVLLLWPRHGEPVMILNHYAAPLAQRDSWLQRIEVYDDYAESPYARLAALLQQWVSTAALLALRRRISAPHAGKKCRACCPQQRCTIAPR